MFSNLREQMWVILDSTFDAYAPCLWESLCSLSVFTAVSVLVWDIVSYLWSVCDPLTEINILISVIYSLIYLAALFLISQNPSYVPSLIPPWALWETETWKSQRHLPDTLTWGVGVENRNTTHEVLWRLICPHMEAMKQCCAIVSSNLNTELRKIVQNQCF